MSSFDLQLTRFEKKLMTFYRAKGTKGIVGLVTLVSVAGSSFITMGLIYPFVSQDVSDDGFWYFLGGGIGVPLLIAPLATAFFARLLVLLDRSFQIVESLSTTDPLTGSANRRGFFSLAEQNIRALREESICGVGMVDLNNFKTLNDTHGHPAGDIALVNLAEELQLIVGESGTVGRIGGDEFALLLIAEPTRLASIKADIEQHCTRFPLALENGNDVFLSASVGIVELGSNEAFEGALARADALLYTNKKHHKAREGSVIRTKSRT